MCRRYSSDLELLCDHFILYVLWYQRYGFGVSKLLLYLQQMVKDII